MFPYDPRESYDDQLRKMQQGYHGYIKNTGLSSKVPYEHLPANLTPNRGLPGESIERQAYQWAANYFETPHVLRGGAGRQPMRGHAQFDEDSENAIRQSQLRARDLLSSLTSNAGRVPMSYAGAQSAAAGRAASQAIGGGGALPPGTSSIDAYSWLREPGMRSYDTIISELQHGLGAEAIQPGTRQGTNIMTVGGQRFVMTHGPGGGMLIGGHQVPAQVTYTGQSESGQSQYSFHRPSEWIKSNLHHLRAALGHMPMVGEEFTSGRMGASQEAQIFSTTVFNAAEGQRLPFPGEGLPGAFATRKPNRGAGVVGYDPQAVNRIGLRPVGPEGTIYASAASAGKATKAERNLFAQTSAGTYSTLGPWFQERAVDQGVGVQRPGERQYGGQRGFVYITPSQGQGLQEGMQYMHGGGRLSRETTYRVGVTEDQFARYVAGKYQSALTNPDLSPEQSAAIQADLAKLPQSARDNPLAISGYGPDAPWSPSNRALQLGEDLRLKGQRQPGWSRRVTNVRPDLDTQSLLIDVEEQSSRNPLMSLKAGGVKGYVEQVGARMRQFFQPNRLSDLDRPGLEGLTLSNMVMTSAKDVGVAALNSIRAMTPEQLTAIADIQGQKAGYKRGAQYLRQIAGSAITEGGQTIMNTTNLNVRARTAVARTLANYFTVFSGRTEIGGEQGGQIGYMFPALLNFRQEFTGPRPNINAETMAALRMAGNAPLADYLSAQGAHRQERAIHFFQAEQSNELGQPVNMQNPLTTQELASAAPGIYASMQESGTDLNEPGDRTRAFMEALASSDIGQRPMALGVGNDQTLYLPSAEEQLRGGGRAAVGRGFANPMFGRMARLVQSLAGGETSVPTGKGSIPISEYASRISSEMSEQVQGKKFRRALTGTEPGYGAYFPTIGAPDVPVNEMQMSMRDMVRASGMTRGQVEKYLAENQGVMPMWVMRQPSMEGERGGGMVLGARLGKAGQAPRMNPLAAAAQRGDTDPDLFMTMAAVNRQTGEALAPISTEAEIRAMSLGNASREGESLQKKQADYMQTIGNQLNRTMQLVGQHRWKAAGRSLTRASNAFGAGIRDIFGLAISPAERAAASQNEAVSKGGMARTYNALFRRMQFTMNAQNNGLALNDPRRQAVQAMTADIYQHSLDLKGVRPEVQGLMDIIGNTSLKGGTFVSGKPGYFQGGPPETEAAMLTHAIGVADVLRGDTENQDLYQTQLRGVANLLTPYSSGMNAEEFSQHAQTVQGILGGSGSVAERAQGLLSFYGSNPAFAQTSQERFWGGGGAQSLLHQTMGEAMAERSLKQMGTREDYLSGRRPSGMSDWQYAAARAGQAISGQIAAIGRGKANQGNLSVGTIARAILNPASGLFGNLAERIYGASRGEAASFYQAQQEAALPPNLTVGGVSPRDAGVLPGVNVAEASQEIDLLSQSRRFRKIRARREGFAAGETAAGQFSRGGEPVGDDIGERGTSAGAPPQPPSGGPPPVIGAGGLVPEGGDQGGRPPIPHYGEQRTRKAQGSATALARAISQYMGADFLTPEVTQSYLQQMGSVQADVRAGSVLPKKMLAHLHQISGLVKGTRITNPQEDEMDLPAGRALSRMTAPGTALGDLIGGLSQTQEAYSSPGHKVSMIGDLEASYQAQKASGRYADAPGSQTAASLDRIGKHFANLHNMLELTSKNLEDITGQKGQKFLGWLQSTIETIGGGGAVTRGESKLLRGLMGAAEGAVPGIARADAATRQAMIESAGQAQGPGVQAALQALYGGQQPAAQAIQAGLGTMAMTGGYAQPRQTTMDRLMGGVKETAGNLTSGWNLFMANRLWSFGGRPVVEAMQQYQQYAGQVGGAMTTLGTPEWAVGGPYQQSMRMAAQMSNAQLSLGRAATQAWMPILGAGTSGASGGMNAAARDLAILGPSAAIGGIVSTMAPAAIAGPLGLAAGVGAAAIGIGGTVSSQLGDTSERARIAYSMQQASQRKDIGYALLNLPETISYDVMALQGKLPEEYQRGAAVQNVIKGGAAMTSLAPELRSGAMEGINARMASMAGISESQALGLTTYYMRAYGQQANWSDENYRRMAQMQVYNPQTLEQLQGYTGVLGASAMNPAAMRIAEQRITGMSDTIQRERILGGIGTAAPIIQSRQRMGNAVTWNQADQLALQMNDYNNPNQVLTNQAMTGIQTMQEDLYNQMVGNGMPGWYANLTAGSLDRSLTPSNYFERAPLVQNLLSGDQRQMSRMAARMNLRYKGQSIQTQQVAGQGTEGAPMWYDYASQADSAMIMGRAASYVGGADKIADSVKKGVVDALTGAAGGAGGAMGLAQYKSSLQYGWQQTQQQWSQQDLAFKQAQRTGAGLTAFGVSAEYAIGDEQLARKRFGIQQQQQQMQNVWQGQDMALQQKQFMESWSFNMNRMMTSFGQQQQQMTFNRSQQVTQQQWAAEDLSFNRGQSQLQFGWKMQDMDLAIRTSQTGAERRSLVKQQQRETVMYAMQQAQYDKQEQRQQTQSQWADEQYAMDKRNFEQNRKFSIEEAQMNKKHFEERMALDRQRYTMNVQWSKQLLQLDQVEFERNIQIANYQAKIDAERLAATNAYNNKLAAIGAAEQAIADARQANDMALLNFLKNDLGKFITQDLPKYLNQSSSSHTQVNTTQPHEQTHPGTGGYASGGYTGDGPKYEKAGTVDRGEWVVPQEGALVLRGDNQESVQVLMQILAVLQAMSRKGGGTVYISTNDPDTGIRVGSGLLDAAHRAR